MGQLCEIEMEAAPASITRARSFVAATLTAWSLERLCDTAVLLTSELATNALLHAHTPFRVAVVLDADLTVEVTDGSVDMPFVEPDGLAPRRGLPEDRGRGLLIVSSLSDRWGSRRLAHGKVVWFSLDLS